MLILRGYLVIVFLILGAYTGIVMSQYGLNFVPSVFEVIGAKTWPGQFTLDFATYLVLSAAWVMWRHRFSAFGIVAGIAVWIGGMMLLAPYLLYAIREAKGDAKQLLLGEQHQTS